MNAVLIASSMLGSGCFQEATGYFHVAPGRYLATLPTPD